MNSYTHPHIQTAPRCAWGQLHRMLFSQSRGDVSCTTNVNTGACFGEPSNTLTHNLFQLTLIQYECMIMCILKMPSAPCPFSILERIPLLFCLTLPIHADVPAQSTICFLVCMPFIPVWILKWYQYLLTKRQCEGEMSEVVQQVLVTLQCVRNFKRSIKSDQASNGDLIYLNVIVIKKNTVNLFYLTCCVRGGGTTV